MLRYLADEDFNHYVVQGLRRRSPEIDIVRVQDVGLGAAKDPEVLGWAACHEQIVLTHDISTMPDFADRRIVAGEKMAGVFVVPGGLTVPQVIDDLLLLAHCSRDGEWEGRVIYLPL